MFITMIHQGLGVSETMLVQGFKELNLHVSLRMSSAPGEPNLRHSPEESDIVLIFRTAVHQSPRQVLELLDAAKSYNCRIAILDVDDDSLVHRTIRHESVSVYFKREYLIRPSVDFYSNVLPYLTSLRGRFPSDVLSPLETIAMYKSSRLRPLPLSYIPEESLEIGEPTSKKYSVSYLARLAAWSNMRGNMSAQHVNSIRLKVARTVREISGSRVYLGLGGASGIPHSTYLKTTSESVAAVSTYGSGYDTMRYWEIPYAGAVLVSEQPRTMIHDNFVHGKHAFFFDNLKELKATISYLIEDPDMALKIARESRHFVMKHHSPKTRAMYILETIRRFPDSVQSSRT